MCAFCWSGSLLLLLVAPASSSSPFSSLGLPPSPLMLSPLPLPPLMWRE